MLDSDSQNAVQGKSCIWLCPRSECEALILAQACRIQLKGSGSYVLGTVKCRSSNPNGAFDYKSRMLTKFEQARCGPAGGR